MKSDFEKNLETIIKKHRDAFQALADYDKQILPCEVEHLLEVIAIKTKRIEALESEVLILEAALARAEDM